ncbi:MAG: hypothetical protein RL154_794 [Pseudomonadota bacterium]|jgi:uroporphyrin-III C-methyltransferase/precorrin-2 dehydrogenase/sirohydrochlorin ferrochelatase
MSAKIYLIGCGPGDKKHLTLEAYELLQTLEVALVDGLVGAQILELLPKSCEVVNVAKKKGSHSLPQEEINALLLKYAQDGKIIGRLKGGDPCVFARSAEEASYLHTNGFDVKIVSGISSSLLACASSGVLPTLRGVSAAFSVVSAHLRESNFNSDWIDLLKLPNHTTIVLMSYSFAAKIKRAAKNAGIDMTTPAAYVSKIDTPEQKTVVGTLENLDELTKHCDKPAVLIIGQSVLTHEYMPYIGNKSIV